MSLLMYYWLAQSVLYLTSQRKSYLRRCTQVQRRCKRSGWHEWRAGMLMGLKNLDLRMSTYDVLKHASWRKEW